jgi:hypothetical protein
LASSFSIAIVPDRSGLIEPLTAFGVTTRWPAGSTVPSGSVDVPSIVAGVIRTRATPENVRSARSVSATATGTTGAACPSPFRNVGSRK